MQAPSPLTRPAWFATRQRVPVFPTTPDGIVAVWRFADGVECPELTDGTCICPRTGCMGPLYVIAYPDPDAAGRDTFEQDRFDARR